MHYLRHECDGMLLSFLFRYPDEAGWKPAGEALSDRLPRGGALATPLGPLLPAVLQRLCGLGAAAGSDNGGGADTGSGSDTGDTGAGLDHQEQSRDDDDGAGAACFSGCVSLSSDPGRFVCNSTYFASLDACRRAATSPVDVPLPSYACAASGTAAAAGPSWSAPRPEAPLVPLSAGAWPHPLPSPGASDASPVPSYGSGPDRSDVKMAGSRGRYVSGALSPVGGVRPVPGRGDAGPPAERCAPYSLFVHVPPFATPWPRPPPLQPSLQPSAAAAVPAPPLPLPSTAGAASPAVAAAATDAAAATAAVPGPVPPPRSLDLAAQLRFVEALADALADLLLPPP